MPTVLVQGRIAAPRAHLMRRHAPDGWDVTVWDPETDDVAGFEPLAVEADVIVGGAIPIPWPEVPRLKLFQIPWTGYDFTAPQKMPRGVPVANTFEHESSIAEYVLLGMLEWQIGLRRMDADFRRGGWCGHPTGRGRVRPNTNRRVQDIPTLKYHRKDLARAWGPTTDSNWICRSNFPGFQSSSRTLRLGLSLPKLKPLKPATINKTRKSLI